MNICLMVLIGLLGLCVGAMIGMVVAEKINHDYFLSMNDNFETYFKNMIKIEEKYFNNVTKDIMSAINDINKVYEKPIWRKQRKNYHHVQDYIMAKLRVIHMEKMLCGKWYIKMTSGVLLAILITK